MPYVNRDAAGEIISLHRSQTNIDSEWLEADNSELLHFISHQEPGVDNTGLAAKVELNSTDFELIRVIEDVVDLLIEKKVDHVY